MAARTGCTGSASTTCSRTSRPTATWCSSPTRGAPHQPAGRHWLRQRLRQRHRARVPERRLRRPDRGRRYRRPPRLHWRAQNVRRGTLRSGVLSSWVIGHTNRFAAAAVRCPVTNWLSFLGRTDVPFFTANFFEKPFWEARRAGGAGALAGRVPWHRLQALELHAHAAADDELVPALAASRRRCAGGAVGVGAAVAAIRHGDVKRLEPPRNTARTARETIARISPITRMPP